MKSGIICKIKYQKQLNSYPIKHRQFSHYAVSAQSVAALHDYFSSGLPIGFIRHREGNILFETW